MQVRAGCLFLLSSPLQACHDALPSRAFIEPDRGRVLRRIGPGGGAAGAGAAAPAAGTAVRRRRRPRARAHPAGLRLVRRAARRSEEHTSELQSLMRSSYAVFGLKKKTRDTTTTN